MLFRCNPVAMMLLISGRIRPREALRRKGGGADGFSAFYALSLVAFLSLVLGNSLNAIADYPIEILICLATGGVSIYGQLLSLKRQASINFVSFVFCYLFMSAAPIVQLGAYTDPIFSIDHWTLWAAVNGLLFTVIGAYLTKGMKRPDQMVRFATFVPARHNYMSLFLLSVITSSIAIALFHDSLFSNRDDFGHAAAAVFSDPVVSLMARMLLLATPFFATVLGLRAAVENRHQVWVWLFSFSMVLVAVINNPIVNPRYQLAGLIFFAIDYFFCGRRTKLIAILLVVGVLVAPLLQVFRYKISSDDAPEGSSIFSSTLLSKDYDAFQISCYTMLTVEGSGISWGSNILGATLFFVPRAVWQGKPEPTAWIVYEVANHSTDLGTSNLSTPLMAEGYFAFGWPGALLISILYWWTIARTTELSWKDRSSWVFLSRCLFAGLVLIFLRGTLTVGVSAVAGYFVAAAIPAHLLRMGITRRSLRRRSGEGTVTGAGAIRRSSRLF